MRVPADVAAAKNDPGQLRKARWVLLMKVGVTAVLCSILVWKADWNSLQESLMSISPWYLAATTVMMVLGVTLSAYKWQRTLALLDVRRSFASLHRFYFTAGFFNNFLPSSIGGDGYRILRTFGPGGSRATAVLAVLLERLSGILVLLALGWIAALAVFLRTGDRLAYSFGVVGAICGFAAAVVGVAAASGPVRRMMGRAAVSARIGRVVESLGVIRSRTWAAAVTLVGISVAFHLHTIGFYLVLLHGLGTSPSITELTVILSLTTAAGILPISINGIGVVDSAFVVVATHYGIPFSAALSAMVVVRGVNLLISAVGGIFYLQDGRPPRTDVGVSRSNARTRAPAVGDTA